MNQILTVADISGKGADRHKIRHVLEGLVVAGSVEKDKQGNKVVYTFDPQQAPEAAVLGILRSRKAQSIQHLAHRLDMTPENIQAAVQILQQQGVVEQPFHTQRFRLVT